MTKQKIHSQPDEADSPSVIKETSMRIYGLGDLNELFTPQESYGQSGLQEMNEMLEWREKKTK